MQIIKKIFYVIYLYILILFKKFCLHTIFMKQNQNLLK